AVKPFVLEEEYGIVAANRGAQQAGRIERIRRKHHAQAGNVGEDTFTALRVIKRPAGQIAADGYANYQGGREGIGGAPADDRQLVAQLHHRRPYVIEKLDFDHGLKSARSHASSASYDIGLGQRGIKYAIRTEIALQAESQLEYAAFSFDKFLLEIFFSAAVGHIFAE